MRALAIAISTAVFVTLPRIAAAQEACATAYESAQERRRDHELVRSKAELRLCERVCPTELAADCTRWRGEVERDMPTVKLAATTFDGQPKTAVRVALDGVPLVASIDDTSIEIDPGARLFQFTDATGAHVEVRLQITERQKDYVVKAVFPKPLETPPIAPPPDVTPVSRSPVVYVIGGIGLAGLAVGGVLGIKGQIDRSDLRGTCAPNCAKGRVDAIATEWTGGAIAAGVGAAALGTAVVLWFVGAPKRPKAGSVSVGVSSVSVAF